MAAARRSLVALVLASLAWSATAYAQSRILRPETAPRPGPRPEIAHTEPEFSTPAPNPPGPVPPVSPPPPLVIIENGSLTVIEQESLHGVPPLGSGDVRPAPAPAEPREQGVVLIRPGTRPPDGFLEVVGETVGAVVHVDGREVGYTPLRKAPVEPGERKVRVSKYGYKRFEARVTVEPGKVARVQATLRKLK